MKILVTGSTDGLGRAAAQALFSAGHDVTFHARNPERAALLSPLLERGAGLVVGDFKDRGAVLRIAGELNDRGPLDAVIHNAGVWSGPAVMPVNVIAPYLLTALLDGPGRHVYLSSGSHFDGHASLDGVDWQGRRAGNYSDSKLFVTALSAAVARLRPEIISSAVDPGWVPTKMGGPNAPDDFELGHQTQEWLATSEEPEALASGKYWYHREQHRPHKSVTDVDFQERLLSALARETNTALLPR